MHCFARARLWDYIPDWNCWISAGYTNQHCESRFNLVYLPILSQSIVVH